MALIDRDITVYQVQAIADAWILITAHRPQVVLLTIRSGQDEGYEFCRQMRQIPQTASIPILFVGPGENKHDRLRAFEAGGVDFISTPYWPEEVLARVQLHLSSAPNRLRPPDANPPAIAQRGYAPLLANLQKTLHQQTLKLQAQNVQLQREIHERQEIETALRQAQQKSEQLLLNILPEAIVTQLKQCQGSLAERFDEATVLFADIVNFTPIAAQCTPLELVNLLNQIFSEFDRLADSYQLEKIKTIGDAYMAVGGVPVPQADHEIAVADMALAMQAAIRQITPVGEMPLQLRIGINTGSVIAGVIGIKKFSYDLWGDTVNVASRMESQGQPDKIQVTEATYSRLRDQFRFAAAQELEIKGKGLMRTYYLLGRL
ncbi:MAG: response regulator [Leptolyngbya sp. SIOISBB]|nr:response regulator [Leptolyngbya sp. SIOISBB]